MNAILNNILEKELLEKELLEKKKSAKINYWYNAFINIHNLICQLIISHDTLIPVTEFKNILEKDYEIIYALQN
jgi:hypothetical protein